MANLAYDFSLFEERNTNTAPELEPRIEEQPQQGAVVELPEQPGHQPEPGKRSRPSLLKVLAGSLCFAVLFGTGITAVYSEVQLTELSEEISKVQTQLEEAQSLEVQLNMQAAQLMTDAQVENYAVQQLGMGKLAGSQVVYMHVAQQDKGRVVQEIEGGSWLDKIWREISSWLS
ncbi:MAG: hypothetical protein HFE95_09755 [Acutalibacter sp.]|jgi:cell division protein FtsL|nr:hypothetical protein [Acutalibacter sp.]